MIYSKDDVKRMLKMIEDYIDKEMEQQTAESIEVFVEEIKEVIESIKERI